MNLCYFKGDIPNFGDDLNPYIFNHLMPNYKTGNSNVYILFIGTILSEAFINDHNLGNKDLKKIVLGSGIRFINKVPQFDYSWDFHFVRGPLSSACIQSSLKKEIKYITDPGYLILKTPFYKQLKADKKYDISFMPHFRSLNQVNWKAICDELGYHFIDPSEPDVEKIMLQIKQSKCLMTEAMHGAIIADALRVPWLRFKCFSHLHEQNYVSEFKWSDWLYSMGLKHENINLEYSRYIREFENRVKLFKLDNIKKNKIISKIKELNISSDNFQLSDSKLLETKTEELEIQLKELIKFNL
ncbi:succinoglycan biosynthesis ketolase [Formosa agariphila KMM 3901]|uniref:Succinoglycan biosynthesis ketolase n=1 Tax=Formosa agariphila (strain DSM 15362 / KCTC 12365 / LMG 23005 / KMM 3901 / M-2Alg 35-1) TaxID=1347342 RepID=T2KRJ0_FORAG|nr:polysaccharide pyruvyl transferase family protein [Formosa agariphila]CDF80634.1 succinoglycan biosynthesis ketolase [Formosa agariphila KMM 3901]